MLDIETDSTIMADENAEKQRRTEFIAGAGLVCCRNCRTMIQNEPKTARVLRGNAEIRDCAISRRPHRSTARSTS